ncbi:DMT family transporter [Lactobacillus corticis]|uniref:Drug/metabolite transporter permease n=1 Tax=Lactobacillus corticis TaxID=2201249 RepID=A0A916QIW3_9LACO|nr:EamA family transporter [Lactobacillus corticis]GFZ26457.1 drug/metabolite transporter permease [Lactobacillus corticis]
MTKQRLWALLAAGSCIMWGISGLFGKALFEAAPQADAIWLSQVRMLVSGLVMLAIAGMRGLQPLKILKNKQDLWQIVAYGIFGLLPVQACYFIAVQLSNASIATILQFLGPFFVIAYLGVTKKQVIRRLDIIASIVAFLGVALLSTHGRMDQLAITPIVLFWGILSAIGEANNTLLPIKVIKKYSSLLVTGWGMLFSGIALSIMHPHVPKVPNTPMVWGCVLSVILIGTIIPFQLMASSLRYIKPSVASMLDAFEPLSATIGSVLVFGLQLTPLDWLGSVMVVVAVLALNIMPKKKPLPTSRK